MIKVKPTIARKKGEEEEDEEKERKKKRKRVMPAAQVKNDNVLTTICKR